VSGASATFRTFDAGIDGGQSLSLKHWDTT
jgi:hypothetical protein